MGLRAWISSKIRAPGRDGRATPWGYDAGRITRVDPDFVPQAMGPNLSNYRFLRLARLRSIALTNDNPLISGARDLLRRNAVGHAGIVPQPATGLKELDKKISDSWWSIAEGVDVSREDTIAVSQGEWFNQLFPTGEAMINVPVVSPFRGYGQGPALELVDSASRVDLLVSGVYRGTGNKVRQGVEFDAQGRRVAYHVFVQDPYDNDGFAPMIGVPMLGGLNMTRLPAEQATMGFGKRWMSQVRGMPWTVAITSTVRMEDSFRESEMLLAKAKAAAGVAIKGATGPLSRLRPNDPSRSDGVMRDANGAAMTELQPGMFGYLPPNSEIVTIQNTTPGATLEMATRLLQRVSAVGLGMGYGSFARDRSQSTFSSDRSDSLEDRKGYREIQAMIWHRHTRPFYEAHVAWCVLSGKLKLTASERALFEQNPRTFFNVTVIAPGWEWVDPYKEAQADQVALATGAKTLQDVCAGMGAHWEDKLDQAIREEEAWNEKRAAKGLPPASPPWRLPPPTKGVGGDAGDAVGGTNGGGDGTNGAKSKTDSPEDETNPPLSGTGGRLAALNGHAGRAH